MDLQGSTNPSRAGTKQYIHGLRIQKSFRFGDQLFLRSLDVKADQKLAVSKTAWLREIRLTYGVLSPENYSLRK